MTVWGRSTTGK